MGNPTLRPSALRRFLLIETSTLTLILPPSPKNPSSMPPHRPRRSSPKLRLLTTLPSASGNPSVTSPIEAFPFAEEALTGFIAGKRKATEVVHSVWKSIIRKGDTVVDATCGNGHDTLALLKMIADESGRGCVYGMDIQNSALENTSSLLEMSVDRNERKLVKLFSLCHSKMEDIVPKDAPVRLIAFNLGYLPGGDKAIITMPQTTLMALQAASRILMSEGLISIVVYVGHPGGRNELETVQTFASSLPSETWVSCKFEMLNRPTGPILVVIYKK